jgi:chromosome segregation ATPase
MTTGHGGKRDNAGRKKIADTEKKKTAVIRVDVNLLPAIEQLKQGLNPVTENQAEIERLTQINANLVDELDNALREIEKLVAEHQVKMDSLKAENEALKAKLNLQKINKQQDHQEKSNGLPNIKENAFTFGNQPK